MNMEVANSCTYNDLHGAMPEYWNVLNEIGEIYKYRKVLVNSHGVCLNKTRLQGRWRMIT
jgi:hypothetical protein